MENPGLGLKSQTIYPLVMTNSLLLKMAIEIVDLFIEHGDFPVPYVKLPECIT